ncbi:MAG: glutathione S-transferase family protein [Sphingomonadales bacterium]
MLKLVIGNKIYSTWSIRVIYLLRYYNIPHEEILVPCFHPESKRLIGEHSPTGMVPVLKDGDHIIWDSLAIVEYISEKFPDKNIWPRNQKARSLARSIAAEIHGGKPKELASACPFNLGKIFKIPVVSDAIQGELNYMSKQVKEIQSKFGTKLTYLFGEFSAADAFYAVTLSRLNTYSIEVPIFLKDYMNLLLEHKIYKKLTEEAHKERWIIDFAEEKYPVLKDFRGF